MNNLTNRLQFVHCDKLFATSEEAKNEVRGQLETIQRPALYGEPMVLKYGDPKNPNIILAIGSVGDGVEQSFSNKTFFIDFAQLEEDLKKVISDCSNTQEDVKRVVNVIKTVIEGSGLESNGTYKTDELDAFLSQASSLYEADKVLSTELQKEIERAKAEEQRIEAKNSLEVKDSRTIDLKLEKSENGSILSGGVKVSKYKTVGDTNIPNILLKENDGLYVNVDLKYNDETSELTFKVNGEDSVLQLPKEVHVQSGKYDEVGENLVLLLNNGNEIVINLTKLIGEWDVMGEYSKTPVVLTKTPVTYDDKLHGKAEYQDILSADIRLADEVNPDFQYNILKRSGDGRSLFVKGIASNITYFKQGKPITVQEALDNVKTPISSHEGNIITEKADGIFANVKLSYSESQNVLTFDNGIEEVSYKLTSAEVLERAYYDQSTESLILIFRTSGGTTNDVAIPLKSLITEWEVDNTNHTVTLTKTAHAIEGQDKLSADVNIADNSDFNILKVKGHALYVKGTADNIHYKGNETVFDELEKLNGNEDIEGSFRSLLKEESDERAEADKQLQANIDAVSSKLTKSEKALNGKISEEVTRAKLAEAELDKAITSVKDNLESEVLRSTSFDEKIDGELKAEIARSVDYDERLNESIKEGHKELDEEIKRAIEVESKIKEELAAEIVRATTNEQRIEEKVDAHLAETDEDWVEIKGKVGLLEDELQKEIKRSTNRDEELSAKVDAHFETSSKVHQQLADSVTANSASIANMQTDLTAVKSKADGIETSLDEFKTHSQGVHTDLANGIKELTTKVDANNETLTSEVNELKKVDETLKAEIGKETTRATNAENVLNANILGVDAKVIAEIDRSSKKDAEFEAEVKQTKKDLSFAVSNSGTLTLTKELNAIDGGFIVKGKVNVSTAQGNIINQDEEALYANVDLTYDKGTNTLMFSTTNGVNKEIKLATSSLLDSITYDSINKEIVIRYHAAGSEQALEMRFPASDLFNEFVVNKSHNGGIRLSKELNTEGNYELSAEVVISSDSSNILVNDNGVLKVNGNIDNIQVGDGTSLKDALVKIQQDINTESVERKSEDALIRQEIGVISIEVDTNKTAISEAQTKITKLEENVVEVKEEIGTIKIDIQGLTDKVTELENQEVKLEVENSETCDLELTSENGIKTLKVNVKVSDDEANLVKVDETKGIYFDGSIDYGVF